ncbi:uncharacterized protein DS421_11g332700 [Arachis hypogaea]|nr:uncharacterized protein DS421_11g332700 [Arachis hypogaea]
MGRLRLMPKTFALRAVQRHAAASRSTRPFRREQQGATGGCPKVTFNRPLSTLAHTPSLSASRGQAAVPPPPEGVDGVDPDPPDPPDPPLWWCLLCFGGGGHGALLAETSAKKRMLSVRKRAREVVLEAISST